MSRIVHWRAVAIATLLALLPAHFPQAATLKVVADGVPRHLVNAGNPAGKLSSQDGAVVLADFRGFFPVTAKLGNTFTATIRMAVDKAKNAGASFVLGGDSHFGFYGGQRRMFLSGPLFKGVVLDRPTPDPVLAGRPFDLEIARTVAAGVATLTFCIDGETILTVDAAPAVESIGFRPSHCEIRIAALTIEGDVRPVAPTALPKSDKSGAAKALDIKFLNASPEEQKPGLAIARRCAASISRRMKAGGSSSPAARPPMCPTQPAAKRTRSAFP